MEDVKLNFLLMGKNFHGKSATGNTILNRSFFKEDSATKDVKYNFSHFGRYVLLVVDGPSLEDTDLDNTADKDKAVKQMSKALAMCYGGIDAFLLVVKYGDGFAAKDKMYIEKLKNLFGPALIEHVIVVVTFGDVFQKTMPNMDSISNLENWCKKQGGLLSQLYIDCKGRFVLFNNREIDEVKKQAQIQQVVQLAHNLKTDLGRFASQCFQDADLEREKLIERHNYPQLRLPIQEKIGLLFEALEKLAHQPSMEHIQKVTNDIRELNCEIDKQEKKYGELQGLRELLKQIEKNLHDKVTLCRLKQELEEKGRPEHASLCMVAVCFVFGLTVAYAAIALGPVAVVAGAIAWGMGTLFYRATRLRPSAAEILTRLALQISDEIAAAQQKLSELKFGQEHGEPPSQDVKKKRTNIAETQLEKDMDKLNYLLLGRTRHGKSSTGNTILNRDVFPTATCEAPVTRYVQCFSGEFGRFLIRVVDGPGIINTTMTYAESVASSVQNMNTALGLCYGSIDAFLLVIKFGDRTAEDRQELEYLMRIFGDSFLDHVIIVMTHGDLFPEAMEGSRRDISFHDWCSQQDEDFRQLCDGCCGRLLLFNNMETDEENKRTLKQKLVQHTQDIVNKYGRYTTERFELDIVGRERLILELKAPQIRLGYQGNIQKLAVRLEQLSQHSNDTEEQMIRELVRELRREIHVQDGGHGVLADLLGQVENMEAHLEEIIRRHNLAKDGTGDTVPPTL